jgi:hypothetical protein
MSKTYFVRTESWGTSSDLEAGIAARVYDPAWMLGRQWQLGELMGEDAGSPVSVTVESEVAMLARLRRSGSGRFEPYDPKNAPLESIVEAESQRGAATWTARLRIDTGREFLRALDDAGLDNLRWAFQAAYALEPMDATARVADPSGARLLAVATRRIPDGELLYAAFAAAVRNDDDLPDIPGVAAGDADGVRKAAAAWLAWCDTTLAEEGTNAAWQPSTLDYSFEVATGAGRNSTVLVADSYRGGSLDWHSFDAVPVTNPANFVKQPVMSVVPTGVTFRGMPNARWWEFEDATIDPGSIDAGASDVARLAFLEFALVYGNDFFAVPMRLPIGSLTRITSLLVTDTFGMRLSINSANRRHDKQGAERFCLFALSERGATSPTGSQLVSDTLFLAPVSSQLLTSDPMEDVLLLRDEMANLAWAVERRYEGERGVAIERHETTVLAAPEPPLPSLEVDVRYALGTVVPPYWFPLVPTRSQGDVLLTPQRMTNQPEEVEPLGRFIEIGGPAIPDAEVPREGTRLLREYAMTRWMNGAVFVWSRRRREIGRGEGSSGLRFDVAEQPT